MTYYYTAMFRPTTGEIQFAEHFEDVKERDKRATQLEAEARRQSPPDVYGKPTDDAWYCYKGEVPCEVYLARIAVEPKEGEDQDAFAKRIQAAGDAVKKTTSVLTAPEVDDTAEARPV